MRPGTSSAHTATPPTSHYPTATTTNRVSSTDAASQQRAPRCRWHLHPAAHLGQQAHFALTLSTCACRVYTPLHWCKHHLQQWLYYEASATNTAPLGHSCHAPLRIKPLLPSILSRAGAPLQSCSQSTGFGPRRVWTATCTGGLSDSSGSSSLPS
jgi:hypothetical protein